MATLHISEYWRGGILGSAAPVPYEPARNRQNLTVSGTSAQSTVFHHEASLIYIEANVDCFFDVGLNPVASVATGRPLTAGQGRYLGIPLDQGYRLAVIEGTLP